MLAILALLALTTGPASASPPAEFGSEGEGAGQIGNQPHGIAIDQETGDVYLADSANNRVDKFDPEGEFLLAFGWGVATGAAEAQTCGPESSPLSATCRAGLEGAGAGQLRNPKGIAVDNSAGPSHGDLYVVDPSNLRVEKFDPSGQFLLAFGSQGAGPGEFEVLGENVVAVDGAGTVYVGERERVQRFDETGAFEGQTALAGAGVVEQLAVDSAKDLYVKSSGLAGVRKYDSTGAELGAPRDASGNQSGAIAVGPADQLFLIDRTGGFRHLFEYDSAGAQLASFDSTDESLTFRSNFVAGVAFGDELEELYLIDYTKQGVRLLSPPPPGPFVLSGSESATAIQPTTATLGATLNPEGGEETKYHFEYGTEAGVYTQTTPVTLLPVNEVQSLTVLAEGGTFTLSFDAEPSAAIPFGATAAEVQSALEAIPALGTGNVAVSGPAAGPWAIEFTGALAAEDVAELSPDPSNLTGPEPSATVATTTPGVSAFADREVSAPIANLASRTTYHFRVVVTNKAGETTDGPDRTFTTLPPVSIESESVTAVTATSALLQAELNPHGLESTYRFEYDTVEYSEGGAPHGQRTPIGEAGEGTEPVKRSAAVQGLTANTVYHYRVVAENELGTVEGPDRTFTTQGPAGPALPDGRGWEMVSPPDKNGIPLAPESEEGGLIQAAGDGRGLTYAAYGAIDAQPPGDRSFLNSQLLARRLPAGGWSSQDITAPNEELAEAVAGHRSEYKLFSTDLSLGALQEAGTTPLSPQTSEYAPYLRLSGGEYQPLVVGCPPPGEPCPPAVAEHANVPPGTRFGGAGTEQVTFLTATPNFDHVLLNSHHLLTPSASTEPGNSENSLYEWAGGALALVSQVPTAPDTQCGGTGPDCAPAAAAALESNAGHGNLQMRHALSDDGSRVVFQTTNVSGGDPRLWLRDGARGETLQLDAVQGGSGAENPSPAFQTASADGSKVFFTDGQRLTADATAGGGEPDLYMCEIGEAGGHLACALKDLTVDHNPGERADLQGAVIGADEAGRYLYFVANGALAPGAVHGDCEYGNPWELPTANSCNLYLYDTAADTTKLVAVLSNRDAIDWQAGSGTKLMEMTARVSPDGRYLAFMSRRSLTGYDNRDAASGEPDQEVYLYHAATPGGAASLVCASCNPTGARPNGVIHRGNNAPFLLADFPDLWQEQWLAASIPGWQSVDLLHALRQPRYLSNSGRLFFNSSDSLVPQDGDGTEDVYQYEPPKGGETEPPSDTCTESSPNFSPKSQGCVDLISSGTSKEESAFLDASENGNDVFFLTASSLAPQDVDKALDVYDAHVCSGELPCPPPPPPAAPACEGDACQQPAVPPGFETPGTSLLNGPGNLLQCPKGKVKRHGKCRTRKHKKSHKKRGHKKQRRAGSNRGGHK